MLTLRTLDGSQILNLLTQYEGAKFPRETWRTIRYYAQQNAQFEIKRNDELEYVLEIYKQGLMVATMTAVNPELQNFLRYLCGDKITMLNTSTSTTVDCSQAASSASATIKSLADSISSYTINTGDCWHSVSDRLSNIGSIDVSYRHISHDTPVDTRKDEKNSMFNFDFGKVTSDQVRFSTYGLAVKSVDGRYVAYDAKNQSVMDVDVLNMPAGDFLYKMPVAVKDIKVGDVVIHNRTPMFVLKKTDTDLTVIDIRESTKKTIMPVKSPFGFNFITKVISLIDMSGASADTPFGNMLPLLMMGDDKNIDPMVMMLASGGKMDMSNPMMMYFLMKDGKMDKTAMMMMLMMNQQKSVPAPVQLSMAE